MRQAVLGLLGCGLFAAAGPLLAGSLVASEPCSPVSQDELRAAIEKSLPLLMKGAVGHRENRTCFACHNQGIPILALTAAQDRGFAIDREELAKQLAFVAKFLKSNRERYLEGKGQGGQVDTAGYALLTLAAGGWQPDDTTAAVTEYLLQYQSDKEHWRTTSSRPPSEASLFTTNYLALAGLRNFATDEQQDRIEARTAKLRDWLLKTEANDTEDRVFRLWALRSIDAPADAIEKAADELIQTQRADGGWSQLDRGEPPAALESDAYATGTALVALHEAGELCACSDAFQRGLRYLIDSQGADGSWHVVSRSKPFQTYFETGFPHGNDQFISAAASAWAAWALVLGCDMPHDTP